MQPGERNFLLLSSKSNLNYYQFTEGDLKVKFLIASPYFKKLNGVKLEIQPNELQILVVDKRKSLYLPYFNSKGYSLDNLKYDKEYLDAPTPLSSKKCDVSKGLSKFLTTEEAYFNLAGTIENFPNSWIVPDFLKNLNPLEKKSLSESWVYHQGVYSLKLKISPDFGWQAIFWKVPSNSV